MTKLISECLTLETFSRLTHNIFIRNETSHTQFTKSELISIRELKDNGIILEMPINICQTGHNLTLFFFNANSLPSIKLPETGPCKDAFTEALAKVDKVENNINKENMVFVDINFTQNDVKLWKNILQQYADNQEQIDHMMLGQFSTRLSR